MLPALASWALYTALLRLRPAALDPLAFILITFIIGLIPVAALYAGEISIGRTFEVNTSNLSAIAYVGIFPSLVAYIFWNRGVMAIGAGATSQFQYLMPIWGSALAVLFLGEDFRLFHLAGIVLIFVGVYLATGQGGRRSRTPEGKPPAA